MVDQSEWVLDQIVDRFPDTEHADRTLIVESLLTGLNALDGVAGKMLFGLSPEVGYSRAPEIRALLREAIEAWRSWCAEHDRDLGEVLEHALAYRKRY